MLCRDSLQQTAGTLSRLDVEVSHAKISRPYGPLPDSMILDSTVAHHARPAECSQPHFHASVLQVVPVVSCWTSFMSPQAFNKIKLIS